MLVDIPPDLIDKALAAVGLVPTGCRDGIMRTAPRTDCVDCRTKIAVVIEGTPYCARHAREHLELLRNKARGLD